MPTVHQAVARSRPLEWRAIIGAGVIAALAFAVFETLMYAVALGQSPWVPTRMAAAILLGPAALEASGPPGLQVAMAALFVNFVLGILYALILSLIIRGLPQGPAMITGGLFGVLIYLVNFFWFDAVYPWVAEAQNYVSAIGHGLFGFVLAWSYKVLCRRRATRESGLGRGAP